MTASIAYILYGLFALGGAALYMALPGVRAAKPAAVILGLAALAGFIFLLAAKAGLPPGAAAYFYIFASVALLATARVITHEKPVYSALYFVLVVLAVAALLVVQQAEFVAVALVIIYAGAILVTYVFVIMLAQQSGAPLYDRRAREPLAAVFVGFVTMAAISARAGELPAGWHGQASAAADGHVASSALLQTSAAQPGNTIAVGQLMLTRYVIALEVAGILLLVAMIGAIAMARKHAPPDEYAAPAPEPGLIGRTVEPF